MYLTINSSTSFFFGMLGIAPSFVIHRNAELVANYIANLNMFILTPLSVALRSMNIFNLFYHQHS